MTLILSNDDALMPEMRAALNGLDHVGPSAGERRLVKGVMCKVAPDPIVIPIPPSR